MRKTASLLTLLHCFTQHVHLARAFVPVSVPKMLAHKSMRTQLKFFNFNNDSDDKSEDSDTTVKEEPYSDDDPVEKLFSFFFGAKEEAPMGMARFGKERFPEQYPAVKDEWADAVESDDKDMQTFRPFLKNTNLEERAVKLSYDANHDGWDPIIFHRNVDKLGGAVVLCETRSGIVGGGYNPKGCKCLKMYLLI